ncbi:MAG: Rrf2 family transcriptional regulator [Bryobacteraceae bacterium]|jgi:Rrf2 family protein
MHISVKGGYALHAVFDLAMHNSGGPVRIADIARRQKIPQKFLELILASLKQGGFVESRRGAEGGYLLARPPDSLTVGEVLQHIEGTVKPRGGRRKPQTPFTDMWQRVDESIAAIVDHTTFAELVRQWTERQARYVSDWEI